jgi:hypothetical protein
VSDPIPEPTGTEYYTGKPRKVEPRDRALPWFWEEDEQLPPDETPESKQLTSKLGVRWFYGSVNK